jgi:hypothetical protein
MSALSKESQDVLETLDAVIHYSVDGYYADGVDQMIEPVRKHLAELEANQCQVKMFGGSPCDDAAIAKAKKLEAENEKLKAQRNIGSSFDDYLKFEELEEEYSLLLARNNVLELRHQLALHNTRHNIKHGSLVVCDGMCARDECVCPVEDEDKE